MASLSLRSLLTRKSTPYILVIVLGVVAITYSLYAGSNWLEKTRFAIRYTARAALLPFIITYCASSLVRFWPNPITLSFMRNRFHWGTCYAIAMAIQAVAFTPLLFMDNNGEERLPVFLGTLTYFVIFGMAVTPLKAAARAGTLVWTRRMHRFGMHWCWFTFFMQYQYYVTHGIRELTSVPLVLIVFGTLALRIAAWLKVRLKRSHTTAAPAPAAALS